MCSEPAEAKTPSQLTKQPDANKPARGDAFFLNFLNVLIVFNCLNPTSLKNRANAKDIPYIFKNTTPNG